MTSPKSKDMKSSILTIGFLFIMTISLSGQSKFADYLTKDLKVDSIHIDFQNNSQNSNNLSRPFVYSSSNLHKGPGLLNDLKHDRYIQLPDNFTFNRYFSIISQNFYAYRNIDNMPIIKPDMNGYLRILKPDTSVIYYIRGQKPFYHLPSK